MNNNMPQKRAQGLSINVIIVAVIGLIILVVVIAMFTGRLGTFGEGLGKATEGFEKTCGELGGAPTVIDKDSACTDDKVEILSKDALPGSGKKCCRCKTWNGAANNGAGSC